jgi:phosphoserine phosphatase RsbU/P
VEELVLEAGDLLALFTDGITEAVNPEGEDFGEDRLTAALEQHRQGCHRRTEQRRNR